MSHPLFTQGCTWYALHVKHPPNVDWCEEKLCSLIVTPFNTWTNLAYIFVAYLMWRETRKPNSHLVLKTFYSAAFWVGVSSFIYHATLNYFTQTFDFFGMYLFCMIMIRANFTRLGLWPAGKKGVQVYWISILAFTLISTWLIVIKFPAQIFVLFLIVAILISELKHRIRRRPYFWYSMSCMVAAAALSGLDAAKLLCFPSNHWFQGHGIWHLLSATALYFAFLHTKLNLPPVAVARK